MSTETANEGKVPQMYTICRWGIGSQMGKERKEGIISVNKKGKRERRGIRQQQVAEWPMGVAD